MAARGLQSKVLITPLSERSHNNYYYTADMVQPKITTCTLGLGTVVNPRRACARVTVVVPCVCVCVCVCVCS